MNDELLDELMRKSNELSQSLKKLRSNGQELAEARQTYEIKKSEEIMRMKDNGESITYILGVINGLPSVAKLRFKKDVAEAIYNANQEAINVLKLQTKLIESQISREWNNG